MNIYDYAMDIEKEGESIYRGFAETASSEELRTVFNWLADAEHKHFTIFQSMKNQETPEVAETGIIEDSVNIFRKIKAKDEAEPFQRNQSDAYQNALAIETKMADFYKEKAAETDNEAHQKIFEQIAAEEQRHQHIMENLIKMVNNPEIWLHEDKFKEMLDYYPL
jgi:rubrerythrin